MLARRYGRTALYQLGLRVHTTLDRRLQAAAEHSLRRGIEALADRMDGFRSAFRRMEPEQRQTYMRSQTQRYDGVDRLDPALTYEGLVTAVRRNSARVQVGPFAGDVVLSSASGVPAPALALHDVIRVRVVDDVAAALCLRSQSAHRGRADRGRSAYRVHQGDGRRLRLQPQSFQPRDPGKASAWLGIQAPRLRSRAGPQLHACPRSSTTRRSRTRGQPPPVDPAELREAILRADHAAYRAGEVAQRRHREARRRASARTI